MTQVNVSVDQSTANAFATSWNTLPKGSVYTQEQVIDWLDPIEPSDIAGKRVLELGCGNGSLLVHVCRFAPAYLEGVDLGASIKSAQQNIIETGFQNFAIKQADLTEYQSAGFDVAYCIGVLHHLKDPLKGFQSLIRNTAKNGRFHGWVYAKEGNAIVIWLVDPLRVVVSRLPWWFTKYCVALPLSVPFYLGAKLSSWLPRKPFAKIVPLYDYSCWIARREFRFFWHVAFDQLVTPQTAYISRAEIERWLRSNPAISPESTYIIFRNGNSWKFGGKVGA